MKGLDHALANYSWLDSSRVGALGASYGGWMINWINGHTNRFKCLVNHDGGFDEFANYFTTEELWFPEWEFKGRPWEKPELYDKFSPEPLCRQVADADARDSRGERFSPRRCRRDRHVHGLAAARHSFAVALFSRRKPLGAQAQKQHRLARYDSGMAGEVAEEVIRTIVGITLLVMHFLTRSVRVLFAAGEVFEQVGGLLGGEAGHLSVGHERLTRGLELLDVLRGRTISLFLASRSTAPLVALDDEAGDNAAVGLRARIGGVFRLDASRGLEDAVEQIFAVRSLPMAERSGPTAPPRSPNLWQMPQLTAEDQNSGSPRRASPVSDQNALGRGLEPSLRPVGSAGR